MGKKVIKFMDTSFRDGFQSVFGARVFTDDFMPALQASVDAGIYHLEGVKRFITSGDHDAFEALLPLVYEELRRLAAQKMTQEKPGQTLQATLVLGDASEALLIPNGAFYQDTGGNWMFVLNPDGTEAVRRSVSLGRRNARFIEVLDGLEAGEEVITSPYSSFREMDRLSLTEN